jgi:hypothetical protein
VFLHKEAELRNHHQAEDHNRHRHRHTAGSDRRR